MIAIDLQRVVTAELVGSTSDERTGILRDSGSALDWFGAGEQSETCTWDVRWFDAKVADHLEMLPTVDTSTSGTSASSSFLGVSDADEPFDDAVHLRVTYWTFG